MKAMGMIAVLASGVLGVALWRARVEVRYLYEWTPAGSWNQIGWASLDQDVPEELRARGPAPDPMPAGVRSDCGDSLDRYHVRHRWLGITFDHYTFRRPDHSGTEWFRGRLAYHALLGSAAAAPSALWALLAAGLAVRKGRPA